MTLSIAVINDVQWPKEQIAFMEDFYAGTEFIPDSKRRLWNGVVEIEFTHANLGVELGLFEARELRGGHGTRALKWLHGLADKHDVSIFADAEPINDRGITNPHDLKQWYLDRGFTKNGGSNVRYFPK